MITVSDAWKTSQLDLIVPEGFVEITLGNNVFTKTDIIKYTHEQTGCLLSGTLPSNKIEFSLDNSDGRYNPNTMDFEENQKLTVRYGFNVNGNIEWIKAGTFYLTEWNTPANGLEATFSARDMLVFMMDKPYTSGRTGTLKQLVERAIAEAQLPSDAVVYIHSSLGNYTATLTKDYTLAEVLQLCANAACCVIYQNRNGQLRIEPLYNTLSDYAIQKGWAYLYPEYEITKPLKAVRVAYANDGIVELSVASNGETQTMENELIDAQSGAYLVAHWVGSLLKNRRKMSGEFRADPRLDLFDKVRIESKYGVNEAVLITNIKYSYTGSFRASYSGRVVTFDPATRAYFCGDLYCGEV